MVRRVSPDEHHPAVNNNLPFVTCKISHLNILLRDPREQYIAKQSVNMNAFNSVTFKPIDCSAAEVCHPPKFISIQTSS